MPAIDLLEQRLADAWPPMAEEYLSQWRLRAAGGFTEHHRYRYWVPGESATCEDRGP